MCGNDWLGDLRALGCGLERRGPHKRADPVDVEDAEFMEAARDAWARLGRLWFDSGSPAARRAPWAAQAFGAAAGLTLADHGIESDGDAEDDETAAEMHR
jgi:hypothetical protein